MKYTPKTKPFPHQARGTIRAVRARNYCLYFEPRCGKSKSALDTVGIHALAGRVRRVLILGPRISLDVWEQQLDEHYPYRYKAETFDESWGGGDGPRTYHPFGGIMLHTEFWLASREETFRRTRVAKGRKFAYERPKQKILEEFDPDLIIVDESHEYGRPGGVAAQDLWRMVRRLRKRRDEQGRTGEAIRGVPTRKGAHAHTSTSHDENPRSGQPWVLLLSGTPGDWLKIFSQFRVFDGSIFGTAAKIFEDRHVIRGTGRRKWTVLGYQHEAELERKLRDHSYSVSAESAGLANKAFYQRLNVDLPANVKKLYLQLAEEYVAEWEGNVITAKNSGVKRLRLLQITGGFATGGQSIHRAKLEKLQAYASLLVEQEESLVVYSRFTPEVNAVEEVLAGAGFRAFRVDGSIGVAARRDALAALKTRPKKPSAISFQYQAGSRAIELVGAAEACYYSTPDGWVDYRQTMARITGPNQPRPVRYTHLICPGTVDVSVVHALQKKESMHDAMMRDPRAFLLGLT